MQGEYIVALENTPTLQNVIVCTLCSCTFWPVLGLPPDWYKSFEYRARVVREARTVLREMGQDLLEAVASRVWDTTAETRDMVLPVRPEGPRGGARRHLLGNTAGFDATGHPAMSIPCACDEGLPIGLQLVGRYFAEADIYCAAHAFEQTTDWNSLKDLEGN